MANGQFKRSLNSFYGTDSLLSLTNIAEMAMFNIKLIIHNDFHLEDEPVSRIGPFNQSLDSLYNTDSPLSVSNIAETANGQFKRSLDSFYVSCSPLSLTNTAEMAMFNIKLTIINDFHVEEEPVS